MPQFPIVDDKGCLDSETIVLTKQLLGFYVNKAPLSLIEGYRDGLMDTCFLLSDAIMDSNKQQDLTLDQFRQQLNAIIEDRLALAELMNMHIGQTRFEKRESRKPI